ncbi:MAG: VWA domain-containing protein [Acidobacteria bacterium]|jgi:Ca-activated chloride channel family protein|nr:VWA domain-containing protein [Acidobacteriota bacterium]
MKTASAFLFIILFCIVQIYSQQPTDSDEVIRVDTSLVVVPTRVTDRRNRNITDLKKEDFRLFEDGIEQTIESFEDVSAPFTIALVLDVSDSTTNKLQSIKAAAIAFLDQLRPNDRILVFTFDKYLNKIADGTVEDLGNVQNSIAFSQTGGGTSLYDATTSINVDYFGKIGGKKAMIIFTDGIDTTSVHQTFARSVRLAEESDVLIYPIQYETVEEVLRSKPKITDMQSGANVQFVTAKGEPLPAAYKHGTLYLRSLANGTGGTFFYADTIKNLQKSFAKIAQELGQFYGLSYYPQNQTADAKRRKIKVTVSVPNAVIEPRKTYIFNELRKKVKN